MKMTFVYTALLSVTLICFSLPAYSANQCGYGERVNYLAPAEGGPGFFCEKISEACLNEGKTAAIKTLRDAVDSNTGIDETKKIRTQSVTAGALFIVPAFIQKDFNHEVIVVVDEACAAKSVYITGE